MSLTVGKSRDTATFASLVTLVICKRGTHTGVSWGTPWPAGGGTAMPTLSCVVDAKLTGVTGWILCMFCT